MKSTLAPLVAATIGLLVTGCTTIDPSIAINARIQEKSETYARMTPVAQKAVQSGTIERGFTGDMVYMALGKPAKVTVKDSKFGKLEMWTYVVLTPQHPTAQDTTNNPDSPGYTPETVATNTPVHGGEQAATSPNGFGFGAIHGSSMGPLNVPDMKQDKVYVFLANDRVAEIKYDSSGT